MHINIKRKKCLLSVLKSFSPYQYVLCISLNAFQSHLLFESHFLSGAYFEIFY